MSILSLSKIRDVMGRHILVLIFVMLALVLTAIFVLPPIDRANPVRLECTVLEVEAGYAGGRAGSTNAMLVLRTQECGVLHVTDGVTFANREALAASMPFGAYDVSVGCITWLLDVIFPPSSMSVMTYQRVG